MEVRDLIKKLIEMPMYGTVRMDNSDNMLKRIHWDAENEQVVLDFVHPVITKADYQVLVEQQKEDRKLLERLN